MQIYIGDGEYADSPGEDPEEAYDNWLFHIARESDDPEPEDDTEYVNETSDDLQSILGRAARNKA